MAYRPGFPVPSPNPGGEGGGDVTSAQLEAESLERSDADTALNDRLALIEGSGTYVPEGALSHWRYGTNSPKNIMCVGDSLEGNMTTYDTWVEALRRQSVNELGADPGWGLFHMGDYPSPLGFEYTNWSAITANNARDIGINITMNRPQSGAVITDIARFVPPTPVNYDRITFYWIDGALGNHGDWQYSLDDGASWVNMGQARTGSTTIKEFTVNGPITTAIRIRPWNGASNVGVSIAGIALTSSTATRGYLFHHLGYPGQFLSNLARANVLGDVFAQFARPGTVPDLIISIYSNDVLLTSAAQFTTNYNRLIDGARVHNPNVDFILICPPEQTDSGGRVLATQAEFRAATRALAATKGVAVLDICEAWGGNLAAHQALGFMDVDNVHPNNAGHADIAWRISRMLATHS